MIPPTAQQWVMHAEKTWSIFNIKLLHSIHRLLTLAIEFYDTCDLLSDTASAALFFGT